MNSKNKSLSTKVKASMLAIALVPFISSSAFAVAEGNSFDNRGPSYTTKSHGHRAAPTRPSKPAPVKSAPAPKATPAKHLPKNISPGECYAQVVIPARYETVTERVLAKEESSRIEIVPAVYEDVEIQVMTKAPSSRLEIVPAKYKTVKEKVMVSPESSRIIEVPAKYKTVTEKILVSPATTSWKTGKNPFEEIDHQKGEIVCLVEEPAKYKTVSRTVVDTPATTRVEKIPASYEWVEKVVEETPASTRRIDIPAEYKTKKIKKLVKAESQRVIKIPAEYKTVTRQKMTSDSYTEWRQILCETNTTAEVIYEIQKSLKAKGYDPGPLDGALNPKTNLALENFQQKKGLPKGSLNFATLKALGIGI